MRDASPRGLDGVKPLPESCRPPSPSSPPFPPCTLLLLTTGGGASPRGGQACSTTRERPPVGRALLIVLLSLALLTPCGGWIALSAQGYTVKQNLLAAAGLKVHEP